jgi:intraflagellar transport protein 122
MRLAEIVSKDSWVWGIACSQTSAAAATFSSDFDRVVLGSDSGSIDAVQLTFDAVHSLYRDRYAYRENLTEIIVHHLISDKKVRIKCKDLVKRISMYKNKLAVQLTDRVCIYESSAEEALDMHFRLRKERISIGGHQYDTGKNSSAEKQLAEERDRAATAMVVTSVHLLFCRSDLLEVYGLDGQRIRVWRLDAPVTFMKVDGGPEGREGILLGLYNGSVVKVFVDNPFPLELYKALPSPSSTASSIPTPVFISGIDVSLYRSILAVVDSLNVLTVIDLRTQDVVYTKDGVMSVCFNSEVNDMLCYTATAAVSSESQMYVVSGLGSSTKTINRNKLDAASTASSSTQPLEQLQHMSGPAIGFQGQKIYCLHRGVIIGADVPHSANMQRALDSGDIRAAYNAACLGATEADLKLLAIRALRANCLDVAKNAFARLKDTKYLSLIEAMERGDPLSVSAEVQAITSNAANPGTATDRKGVARVRGGVSSAAGEAATGGSSVPPVASSKILQTLDPVWQAEILAYEGRHQEAAKTYSRAGKVDEAIRLLTDLRRWEDAKLFAQNAGLSDHSGLTMQQAKWLHEINDWKGAAELFVSMGQHMQAAKIIADAIEPGWQAAMIEVVRACPPEGNEALLFCGDVFNKADEDAFAKETYVKMGDISQLMNLYARRQMWAEAAKLADEHEGKFDVSVFLPYAEWLVAQDLYEEAMAAFKKAGRSDLAKKVLKELTYNAVSESRFKDAAYYYWLLSKDSDGEGDGEESIVHQQSEFELKADLYFAYSSVHAFITDPFTSFQPEMLFQVSRYIINSLGSSDFIPFGISKAATLYTLARQAMSLGAFKLARHAYDRLGTLQTLSKKQDEIELDMLIVQAKPVRDDPDILPVCYRCSSTNPLLNPFTNKFAKGDVCTNCGHPFVRSFVNFDILPLVEFVPEPRISDEEAIDLIRQQARSGGHNKLNSGWKEGKEGESDMMTLDDDDDSPTRGLSYDDDYMGGREGDQDLFTRCVNSTLENQVSRQ